MMNLLDPIRAGGTVALIKYLSLGPTRLTSSIPRTSDEQKKQRQQTIFVHDELQGLRTQFIACFVYTFRMQYCTRCSTVKCIILCNKNADRRRDNLTNQTCLFNRYTIPPTLQKTHLTFNELHPRKLDPSHKRHGACLHRQQRLARNNRNNLK